MTADRFFGGQLALITGGAGGIGAATARAFARLGAAVAVVDNDESEAERVVHTLGAAGEAAWWCVDVRHEAEVRETVAEVTERYGRLDHAVLCAGVLHSALTVDTSLADWAHTIEVNLQGSFLVAREAVRFMMRTQSVGTITFLSSQGGKRGGRFGAAYCASKAGVLGLMQSLAAEVTAHGIRVNAVCPADVLTPMTFTNATQKARLLGVSREAYLELMVKRAPIGRLASPEEIADVCVFLASPSASYIAGESITVDGGQISG